MKLQHEFCSCLTDQMNYETLNGMLRVFARRVFKVRLCRTVQQNVIAFKEEKVNSFRTAQTTKSCNKHAK